MKDEHKTQKVIFRKEFPERGGELIAVFPELPGDSNPYRTCLSYMHTGQHGAITLDYTEWTFPAKESEYMPLYAELSLAVGYNLKVCKRMTRQDLQARIKACEV